MVESTGVYFASWGSNRPNNMKRTIEKKGIRARRIGYYFKGGIFNNFPTRLFPQNVGLV